MRKCVKNVICIVPTIVEGEQGRNCRREHKKQWTRFGAQLIAAPPRKVSKKLAIDKLN